MATYAIGDIQGCARSLEQLLARIAFDPARDRLWLVGDLVNRGPDSLGVLRLLVRLGDAVTAVLGNHDLHALARAAGVAERRDDDTLEPLFAAPDRDALLAWLATRPIAHTDGHHLMVHAGVLPAWDVATALDEAAHAQRMLMKPGFLARFTGRPRAAWQPGLDLVTRAVAALGVFTRVRFVDPAGTPVSGSAPPEARPSPGIPWFAHPARKTAGTPIVFGHWAALGLWVAGDVVGLDSGCVWGGALTAYRLDDRAVFSVPAGPSD